MSAYTSAEILLMIAAVGAVIHQSISAWRTGGKVEQTLLKTAVIEGHVNSRETKYVEQITALLGKVALLERVIADKDATAALLAQAVASRTRVESAIIPAAAAATTAAESLTNIDQQTKVIAANTARLEPNTETP